MPASRLCRGLGSVAVLGGAAAVSAWAGSPVAPAPSSHREAPAIAGMPQVDATDFYMFRSYEPGRGDYVTIVANYFPFQTPYGGPNFFQLDPDALYQVHIDNDGDAREDLTLSFRFQNSLQSIALPIGTASVPVPLINVGGIGPGAADNANLNVRETFSLTLIEGDRERGRRRIISNAADHSPTFRKPVDRIGDKSIPAYEAYARNHIYAINLPGCATPGRVFVGQRKDPFVANLGEIFDLVNLNPLGAPDAKPDSLADDNCTSLVIELPISFLTEGKGPIIGGWTTASLPQTRVLRTTSPTFGSPDIEFGRYVQVSRLGMPLVNEVVVGLPDKNRFNLSEPRDDAQFATYVTNPTLPALLGVLFGVTPPCLPRNDLVSVFLTGLPGLNQPEGVRAAEMLRLNTTTAVTPRGQQNRLGALAGDVAGFPNGRRPGDDVVDAALRVVIGALVPNAGTPGSCAPSGNLPLTDGAIVSDQAFDNVFPYLRTPVASSPALP